MSQIIDLYLPWFILKSVPGVGNIMYRRLIQRFASPENVFTASHKELMAVKGMGHKVMSAIKDPATRSFTATKIFKDEIGQIQSSGFKIVTMTEKNYPTLLQYIPDPPPYLTYFGTLDNSFPSIAIVGSRQATPYGLNTAADLAHDLALKGFQVISGMAVGIDTAAHNGALRAHGRTVGILGSGLGNIYPSENRKLFYKIADNGAVISEFNLHSKPDGRHFPMRNRIIAGMSSGTVVVEAAKKSGSLITARLAAEYNREVFAVPGNIDSFKSSGTHALLKQGARLVENYGDVIEELHHMENLSWNSDIPYCSGLQDNQNGDKPRLKFESISKAIDTPANAIANQLMFQDQEDLSGKDQSSFSTDSRLTQKESFLKPDRSLLKQDNSLSFTPDEYHHAILEVLKSSALHIDIIIEQSGLDTGGITAALMDLELMGIIKQAPGKMFYKV